MPQSLEQKAASAVGRTFRGQIYEAFNDVPLGKGYENQDRPFDINEAFYLTEVFRAILNPAIRKVVIKAGVQSLKTLLAEMAAAYFMIHDPGDMVIYDTTIETSRDHVKSRIGPRLRSIPGIADQIAEAPSRFDVSTQEFYLPGMSLRMWPLNMSSTQGITLRYVIIHDAFMSGRTGMIGQAIARTTQHHHDKKIIIESQGSDEGDDFDNEFNSTDQRMIHVACPCCGKYQPFEFDRVRDDGSYAGFQRGPDERVLLPNGKYNASAIMRETFYECLHCRETWRDTPDIREGIDRSAKFIPENPKANPENVGFNWPNWINRRIAWGGENVMLGYLQAKQADKIDGNKEPLRQWYQKRAARTWSDKLSQNKIPVIIGNYETDRPIEDEDHKALIIDCQKHPTLDTVGTFWYEVYAADKRGNSFQMERGFIEPTPEKDGWQQLDEVQARWKIRNDFVCIDGRKWTPEILQMVAVRRKMMTVKKFGREISYPISWLVFMGDAPQRNSYLWPDKQWRIWSQPHFNVVAVVNERGQTEKIPVQVYRWSNLAVKDQLHSLRIGGEGKPKFEALPFSKLPPHTQAKETGDFSYEMQISSEMRMEKNGRGFWDKIRKDNHYWDIACMRIVRMAMRGLASHQAAPENL